MNRLDFDNNLTRYFPDVIGETGAVPSVLSAPTDSKNDTGDTPPIYSAPTSFLGFGGGGTKEAPSGDTPPIYSAPTSFLGFGGGVTKEIEIPVVKEPNLPPPNNGNDEEENDEPEMDWSFLDEPIGFDMGILDGNNDNVNVGISGQPTINPGSGLGDFFLEDGRTASELELDLFDFPAIGGDGLAFGGGSVGGSGSGSGGNGVTHPNHGGGSGGGNGGAGYGGTEGDPYDPSSYAQTIRYTSDSDAEEINADIIRAEFEDYRNRYLPLENELMRLATDPEERQKAIDSAGDNVRRGFQNASKQSSLSAQRYGIKDPSQMMGSERSRSLAETKSIAHAKNETRTAQDDLKMQIMTGSTGNNTNRLGG